MAHEELFPVQFLLRWHQGWRLASASLAQCGKQPTGITHGQNHKERNLVLVPQAEAILDKYRSEESKPGDYIFPFLSNKSPYAKAETQE